MDIARGEQVEKELDAMFERRSRKGEPNPDEKEEIWKNSVRRHNARRREENRKAWCVYFTRLAGSLRSRAEEEVERRHWNGSLEAPVLVDVLDWTDDRRVFSVFVWPPLESPVETASRDHRERVEAVKEVIGRGAAEMAYSTRFETDYGLHWDRDREVWTSSTGGPAYDGSDDGNLIEASRDAT